MNAKNTNNVFDSDREGTRICKHIWALMIRCGEVVKAPAQLPMTGIKALPPPEKKGFPSIDKPVKQMGKGNYSSWGKGFSMK